MVTEAVRVRTKQPEVRRDQLLDAAERLFAGKGYAETTVADIAEAAGVAKGTFYLYFPSKEHCVLAIKERITQGMIDRFLAVLDPALEAAAPDIGAFDLEAVIRRLVEESFDYAQQHADTFRNLFHRAQMLDIDREHLETEEAVIATLSAAVAQMNEMGITKVAYPPQTARILFFGVHWALDQAVCHGEVDPEQVAQLKEAAVEVCVRALGAPQ